MSPARPKRRQARTLHGTVVFERNVYECPRCRSSEAPLDKEVGIGSHEQMTRRVVKKVAYEAAHASYPEASKNLLHQTGIEVSPAEVARIVEEYGKKMDRLQRERERGWSGTRAPEFYPERLVLGGLCGERRSV